MSCLPTTVLLVARVEAQQAAEGIKVELFLTEKDVALARQGRHSIVVSKSAVSPPDRDAVNRDVVEVILNVAD